MKHNFKNLIIWKLAMEITTLVYDFTDSFPKSENFGLASQLRRCTISVPSNIAEGSSRNSNKDFHRFFRN